MLNGAGHRGGTSWGDSTYRLAWRGERNAVNGQGSSRLTCFTTTKEFRPGELFRGSSVSRLCLRRPARPRQHRSSLSSSALTSRRRLSAQMATIWISAWKAGPFNFRPLPFVDRCLPSRYVNRGAGTSRPRPRPGLSGWPALFRMARATRRSPVATISVRRISHHTAP